MRCAVRECREELCVRVGKNRAVGCCAEARDEGARGIAVRVAVDQHAMLSMCLPARQVCHLQPAWNSATGLRAGLHSRARLCRLPPRAPPLRPVGGRPSASGWP
jgi:hypothetical protein